MGQELRPVSGHRKEGKENAMYRICTDRFHHADVSRHRRTFKFDDVCVLQVGEGRVKHR